MTPLYDLDEIHELWGKDAETIYRAVAVGVKQPDGTVVRLEACGREGHQKFYLRSQLVAAFGEPMWSRPDPVKFRKRNRRIGVNGRNQQSFDLDELAAA